MRIILLVALLTSCTTQPTVEQKAKCSLACLAGTATMVKSSCVSWWRGLGCECYSGETIWIKEDQ